MIYRQLFPLQMLYALLLSILKTFAIATYVIPSALRRFISSASLAVNFFAMFGFALAVCAGYLSAARECLLFCRYVTHSKLSALLFFLSKSMWFTTKPGRYSWKWNATSRWTDMIFCRASLLSPTVKYPPLDSVCFKVFPFLRAFVPRPPGRLATSLGRLRTFPYELTSYIPSNPVTGTQVSFIKAL